MKSRPETMTLLKKLVDVGRAAKRQQLLEGYMYTLTIALMVFLGFYALDYLTKIPYPIRLLFLLGGVSYTVYFIKTKYIQKYKEVVVPEDVSLEIEEAYPDLKSSLISTLQFEQKNQLPKGMSPNLIKGMVDRFYKNLSGFDFNIIIDRRWLKRLLPKHLSVLALLLLLVVFAPYYTLAYIQRLVVPNVKYPTRTVIENVVLPEVMPMGDAIEFRVETSGVQPDMGRVEIEQDTGSKVDFDLMPSDEEGIYIAHIAPLLDKVEARIYLGDDWYGPVEIDPIPRPRISSLSVQITPPAYAKKKPTVEEGGNIKLLAGSTVLFQVTSNKKLKKVELISSDVKEGFSAFTSDQKALWTSQYAPDKSLSYSFKLTDTIGLKGRNIPTYRLSVQPDRVPVIRIIHPRETSELAPPSKAPLEFKISDDLGLSRVRILYRLSDGASDEVEFETMVYDDKEVTGLSYHHEGFWENSRIDVNPGQLLTVWIEATDNAEPEAGVSKSREINIPIITTAEYRTILMERLQQNVESVDDLLLDIKGSKRVLEKLEKKQ